MSTSPKIAVQLWSVKDAAESDFQGTLKGLARMGYQGVEFHPGKNRPFYAGLSPEELKRVVADSGLVPVSSHTPIACISDNLNLELEYAKVLGLRALVIPHIPLEQRNSREGCRVTVERLSSFAEECRRQDVLLCYHNHKEELEKIDGRYVLDVMMEYAKNENFKLELDVGFVRMAGIEAGPFIRERAGEIGLVHVKDPTGDPDSPFAPVGDGLLDVPAVVTACREIGMGWLIVELSGKIPDRMAAVERSLETLRRILSEPKAAG